jgi:acetoin:2,6-dichlorophenolindophenol oxidoreductase subunit beta
VSTTTTTQMTMATAINKALHEAMARDNKVIVFGEDIEDPVGGVLRLTAGLSDTFGRNRVRNTPISEGAIAGAAAGAAMVGYRPVAEIMIADFMTIASDQIVNVAAKHHYFSGGRCPMPLTIRAGVAAGSGMGSTHSQSLEAWFMHVPGLKVAMPSTPADAKALLTTCIFDDDPCIFFENYSLYSRAGDVPEGELTAPVGVADIKRRGNDVTLITYGSSVHICLDAAGKLAEAGIDAEVLDLRWLVPYDVDAVVGSVEKTGRAVIVHHATQFCGPGAEIAAMLQENLYGRLKAPVKRVAAPFAPIPASMHVEAAYFPSVESVMETTKRLF